MSEGGKRARTVKPGGISISLGGRARRIETGGELPRIFQLPARNLTFYVATLGDYVSGQQSFLREHKRRLGS